MFRKLKSVVVFLKIIISFLLTRPFGREISILLVHLQFLTVWRYYSLGLLISMIYINDLIIYCSYRCKINNNNNNSNNNDDDNNDYNNNYF